MRPTPFIREIRFTPIEKLVILLYVSQVRVAYSLGIEEKTEEEYQYSIKNLATSDEIRNMQGNKWNYWVIEFITSSSKIISFRVLKNFQVLFFYFFEVLRGRFIDWKNIIYHLEKWGKIRNITSRFSSENSFVPMFLLFYSLQTQSLHPLPIENVWSVKLF